MEFRQIENSNYYISDTGIVRNNKTKYTKILQQDRKGYLRIVLKNVSTQLVHRLVAKAFIPNYENKPCINHKNGIKNDNRVENLEWCTIIENNIHANKNGLTNYLKGENIGTSILKENQVLEIRSKFKKRIYTREMLGKEYGVSPLTIKDIISGKRWNHLIPKN